MRHFTSDEGLCMFEGVHKQIVAMLVQAAAYKRIIIQSHSRWTSITTSYQDHPLLADSLGVVGKPLFQAPWRAYSA